MYVNQFEQFYYSVMLFFIVNQFRSSQYKNIRGSSSGFYDYFLTETQQKTKSKITENNIE